MDGPHSQYRDSRDTLPRTNSSPLNICLRPTSLPTTHFQGRHDSYRECRYHMPKAVRKRKRENFYMGVSENSENFYMGVSENSGTPKSSILIGFSTINHPFWGTPNFWKHPYGFYTLYCHDHSREKSRRLSFGLGQHFSDPWSHGESAESKPWSFPPFLDRLVNEFHRFYRHPKVFHH